MAHILTRRRMPVCAAAVGLALLSLVSVRVGGLLAQTSSGDSLYDPSEGEEFTPEEEPAYGGEFRQRSQKKSRWQRKGTKRKKSSEQDTGSSDAERFFRAGLAAFS